LIKHFQAEHIANCRFTTEINNTQFPQDLINFKDFVRPGNHNYKIDILTPHSECLYTQ